MKKMVWLGGLVLIMAFSSCSSKKQLTYLQDVEYFKEYPVSDQVETKIKKGDKLDIMVTCKNPELALPFNIVNGGTVRVTADGEMSSEPSLQADRKGYIVGNDGNIDFPILGELHVESLTLDELKHLIESRIIEKNYIRDPMVLAEFMNFQITMLGEVNTKGKLNISNNQVTLLEAIAMAGDLTTNAKRDEIVVIRTENGKRVFYPHDMRSKDIYDSPAFYLQQNDIVYAKPNKNKSDGAFERKTTYLSLLFTFISAAASLYYWVIK